MEIPQFSDFELFTIFNIDMGEAYENIVKTGGEYIDRSTNKKPTTEQKKTIVRLSGVNLWHFRPRQRSDKTINWEALDPTELAEKQREERAARAKQLMELTPQKLKELEYAGKSITSLLPPPKWINPPDQE